MRIIGTRRMIVALAAGGLVFAGCSTDSSGPVSVAEFQVNTSTAPSTQLVYRSKDDPRLLKWLEAEKLRIDAALKASQVKYDSLKKVWASGRGRTGYGSSILLCDPIQYVAEAKIVGPNGEDVGFGPHKLRIPQGALSGYTVITAEAPVSLAVESHFEPHGLKFLKVSNLELSYKHCVNNAVLRNKYIVYVDDFGRILERVRSVDGQWDGIVTGGITHFSAYMVAF